MTFKTLNPYSLDTLETWSETTHEEVVSTLSSLLANRSKWSSFNQRSSVIAKIGQGILDRLDTFANQISKEMGKPITQARSEVKKSADFCQFYAENLESLLSSYRRSDIELVPRGIILGIMPWNFPLWQCCRFAIPALIMGNSVVIKPAPNTSKSAEMFVSLVDGIEPNILSLIRTGISDTESLIQSGRIQGVSLTGSVSAGQRIGELAGRALLPCVLELGGSDPFLVCDDANIDQAAKDACMARFGNAGQTCISSKRFIIHDSVYDSFMQMFCHHVSKLKLGDPLSDTTDMGPLARHDILNQLEGQLDQAKDDVVIHYQHDIVPDKGYFFPPTVLSVTDPNSDLMQSEIFGPIAVCIKAADTQEMIRLANNTQYGLGASVWSQDMKKAQDIGSKIDAGMIAINGLVRSQAHLPFGGIKKSGVGYECGVEGLLSFTQLKTWDHRKIAPCGHIN